MIRLISAVAVLLLAGCAAVPSVPTHLQPVGSASRNNGGAFSATYAGTETNGEFCFENQKISFTGKGSASFLRRSTEVGSVQWATGFNCNLRGKATLTSILYPGNSILVYLTGTTQICDLRGSGLFYTVGGGTGRFKRASGGGHITFSCKADGTYTDSWSGSLNF